MFKTSICGPTWNSTDVDSLGADFDESIASNTLQSL